ncbi:hypothetical protein [Iodobacter ciconiae]|uniref:Glycosyl hydrolase n=1 Tax=Iodobacter ciconiae TaxID=2496266 RepID=A0A3S8ZSA2_9NEIS|nr:hypothetical protein [Iodobacter ciconiae]AZN36334.1 hypothetical protein EJO50_07430 [Iodobacter ciconiae]
MIKILISFYSFFFIITPVFAEQTEGSVKLGDMLIEFKKNTSLIYYKNNFISESAILPGGVMYPNLYISEHGDAVIANKILNNKQESNKTEDDSKQFLISKDIQVIRDKSNKSALLKTKNSKKECKVNFSKKNNNSISIFDGLQKKGDLLAAANNQAGLLITSFDADQKINGYQFTLLNLVNCKANKIDIGNPDFLSELGWTSKGFWWMTGTTNQTLMRSENGTKWYNVKLPSDIYSLVSAYITSKKEIWLAAGIASLTDENDPMLIRSLDGGTSWENIKRNTQEIEQVPAYWIEGQTRAQLK